MNYISVQSLCNIASPTTLALSITYTSGLKTCLSFQHNWRNAIVNPWSGGNFVIVEA